MLAAPAILVAMLELEQEALAASKPEPSDRAADKLVAKAANCIVEGPFLRKLSITCVRLCRRVLPWLQDFASSSTVASDGHPNSCNTKR